ncbi:MAG: type II toxin-antitoxin system Phd/YefM family antitoxin [Colwellia sp.]|nr:type II toxin-antitoxin system Phd/YefM family antitoxin [Colwellia sp.]
MITISANELKTKGVSLVANILHTEEEVIITVRGEQKYVIIDMKKYNKMREYELEVALLETKADIANARVTKESVTEHIKRVTC